jgi:peptide deformylase
MPLEIVTLEHSTHPEVLTSKAAKLSFPLSTEDQSLIQQMIDLVLQLQGVGLAAPQIGISKQIIVYHISENAQKIRNNAFETVPVTVLINPEYTPIEDVELSLDWEACFSVTQVTGKVPRYNKIQYTAQNQDGTLFSATASGFTARVLQHEIDHLQGVLINHRLTPNCIQGHPDKMLIERFKDLNAEQQKIILEIFAKRDRNIDPINKDKYQTVEQMKQILKNKDSNT